MNRSKKIGKKFIFEALIIGFFLSLLSLFIYKIGKSADFFFYNSEDGITIGRTIELFCQYKKSSFIIGLFLGWLIFSMTYILCVKKLNTKYIEFVYKYRYLIALVLLVIGVILEISGSSISSLCGALGVDINQSGVVFRTANPYRSDEFGLNTIFAIAQGSTEGNTYPYISDIVRGTNTDMYIVYGQPVKDIGLIFRPFHWGYLLFGSAKGLAFFWCGRLIFVFMVSFEFCRLLLKNKRVVAVCYGIFIALSPVLQWWFAINGLAEMLIFGQLCAIVLYLFMNTTSTLKRIICSVVFFWSGCVYILLFYPAWQIVFGYVYLGVFIWIIISNRKKFCWNWKKDGLTIFFPALVMGGLLLFLLIRSWDTIVSVMNTVYPGHRVDTNKLGVEDLFGSIYNIYLALTDSHMVVSWSFIDFFPLGIILSIYVLYKQKIKDSLLLILLVIDAVFIILFTLPVPEILFKISLLSLTTCDRALIAIQFLNVILLFRSIQFFKYSGKGRMIWVGALIYSVFVIFIFGSNVEDIPLSKIMILGMIIFMIIGFVLFCTSRNERSLRLLLIYTIMLFSVAGGIVNPIQKGLPMVENSSILQEIRVIAKKDIDAKWISVDVPYPDTNIPLLAGVSTINSTNVYPTLDRWHKLDKTGKYERIYNRYATNFELVAYDHFLLNLNVNDLGKLDVDYILTKNELENYFSETVQIMKIKEVNGYYIYKVIAQ